MLNSEKLILKDLNIITSDIKTSWELTGILSKDTGKYNVRNYRNRWNDRDEERCFPSEQWKEFLITKINKRFSERTIIRMFLLSSGSQSGNRKHWHQSTRKQSYSLLKKTWCNFHTEVDVSKIGQDFYLNRENPALLSTLSTRKEQVRQPHRFLHGRRITGSVSNCYGKFLAFSLQQVFDVEAPADIHRHIHVCADPFIDFAELPT